MKPPCEADLAGDNHARFGRAMVLCQDGSARCASTGSCSHDGDCFRPYEVDFAAACQEMDALCGRAPEGVSAWLMIGLAAMKIAHSAGLGR